MAKPSRTFVIHLEGDVPEVGKNIRHLPAQVLETCRDVLVDGKAANLLMTVLLSEEVSLDGHRHVRVFFLQKRTRPLACVAQ